VIWLAGATLVLLLAFALESTLGSLTMRSLAALPSEGEEWPRVSVVFAARDEELALEEAVRSLLALDYPDLEVVAVDDRSADGTGRILATIAARDARLHPSSIRELPAGWLGKNHALHHGAAEATGELILFTDADVIFEPSALKRAVRYMRERRLDHLTASPELVVRSLGVGVFVTAFAFFFSIFSKPWRVRWRSPRFHVGVGAFNLVRASFYREQGGHEPIRMRPDDDMKLAKLLKKGGGTQELVFGRGMIRVAWYSTVREAMRGLEKNAFSGVEYSMTLLTVGTIGIVLIMLWPFVALFATSGGTRVVYALMSALLIALVGGIAVRARSAPVWYALTFPAGVVLFIFVIWRAALLTVIRGGIDWRGTFYSLRDLRANRV
jgi:glycosyltransferase involved in cell wall biosynthesis